MQGPKDIPLTREQRRPPGSSRRAIDPDGATCNHTAKWCACLCRGRPAEKQWVCGRSLAHRLAAMRRGCLRELVIEGHRDIIGRRDRER